MPETTPLLPLKVIDYRTGEIRRWSAPKPNSEDPRGVGWGRFSRRVATAFGVDEKRLCLTWLDGDQDRVLIVASDANTASIGVD